MFWVEGLPLANGTNELTIIATDAAGNLSATNLSVVLLSQFVPSPGDYLIFAYFDDEYMAVEPYRVVPLGPDFLTDMLAGKQLDDQILTIPQSGLKK